MVVVGVGRRGEKVVVVVVGWRAGLMAGQGTT